MNRIDWEQIGSWTNPGSWTVQDDYGAGGFFHVYAFTMTLGIIIAALLSAYRFWKRDLSLVHLSIAAAIIIPFSLFGASFFGKLNADGPGRNAGGANFIQLFFFWEAGMAIHGGVYVGLLFGIIIFGIISKKTKVSLWTYLDCIVPNILLAQAIGRFGNFFNHEVMGVPVWDVTLGEGTNPLSWLPNWILVNTQMRYTGAPFIVDGLKIVTDHTYQMQPIFFYEVIGFTIGWILLTFLVPNFGKWIGPKPWKKYPKRYTFNVKQSIGMMFQPWKWKQKYSDENQTWVSIWNSAYYYQIEKEAVEDFRLKLDEIKTTDLNKTKKRYAAVKVLNKDNNIDGYWITKVGAEGSGYFFVWNFVRFILELQRPDNHLFIMYQKDLSLVLIMLTALIGLILMVLTQTVIPMFLRQPGWLYEKQYFKAKRIKF